LKRWPALLQSLLGLQCQSRPSAAYVQKNGLQSRIRRVCHHPLTVSGPKPAFKWSKHRHPPKRRGAERPGRPLRSGLAKRHTPHATLPHTLICAQSWTRRLSGTRRSTIRFLSWCCADHTHRCPATVRELGQQLEESQDESWSANSSKSGASVHVDPFA
jgi:hypothetical protein